MEEKYDTSVKHPARSLSSRGRLLGVESHVPETAGVPLDFKCTKGLQKLANAISPSIVKEVGSLGRLWYACTTHCSCKVTSFV